MTTRVKSKWNGKKIFKITANKVVNNMGETVGFLRGEVIKSINKSQPTRRTSSGARVGLNPSVEGEPPKRVEGDLVRSITTDVSISLKRVIGKYGSTQTKKALGLEIKLNRPFLRPALFNNIPTVKRILSK